MSFRMLAVVAALAVVVVAAFGRDAAPVSAQTIGPDIALDCPASAAVGSNFTCGIVFSDPGMDPYVAYSIAVSHNSPDVSAVNGSWTVVTQPFPGGTLLVDEQYDFAFAHAGNDVVTQYVVASFPTQAVTVTGTILEVEFTCQSAGTHDLILVPEPVDPVRSTFTVDQNNDNQVHNYTDAQVGCVEAAGIDKTVDVDPGSPGQLLTFTIEVSNSTGGDFNNVVVTDTFDTNVFDVTTLNIVSADLNGTDVSGSCAIAGAILTCDNTLTIPAGETLVVVVEVEVDTDAAAGSYQNCVNVESDETGQQTECFNFSILPAGVVWHKEFVDENGDPTGETTANLWLSSGGESITFAEIMTNQPDPAGLGAFEFQIWYNNNIWNQPVVDLQPAIDLFDDFNKTLDCSIGFQLETRVHVACVSLGDINEPGPTWVGEQILAYVTFTPKNVIIQSIKPAKYNGVVAWIKNTHIEAANICGSPLNDGTWSFCQGNLVPGMLEGGQIDAGDPEVVVTIRRLEGDVTKDCSVDVGDLQAMASRYGTKLGSLLYSEWYDLEPHQPTSGDGDIDVKDIQFVYGRFGSTCEDPIGNPQEPVNHPSQS